MRSLSLFLIAVTIVYWVFELRRWRLADMAELLTKDQKTRRIAIFACLLIVLGMAFGGTFLPDGTLTKRMALVELGYWLLCFAFAAIVAFIAIFEHRRTLRDVMSRKDSRERNEAYRAMVETVAEAQNKAIEREKLPHRNGQA